MSGKPFISSSWLLVIVIIFCICSCAETKTVKEDKVKKEEFKLGLLAKNDIDELMEIHVRRARTHLRDLLLKLYKRNPRELKKSPYSTAEENAERIFSRTTNWNFRELDGIHGTDAITLAFNEEYRGDRVFAFVMGMTSMVMATYHYKTEFFIYDSIEPQGLYNSARNIEIAVWKLEHSRDRNGEFFILSNSRSGEPSNLSYERLFGKLISLQDTMAEVVAGSANRTISKIIQRMATAVFLPIP